MLRDVFIKQLNRRDDLSSSTARALTLGNDITAFGHSTDTVTSTYANLPAITEQTAIYPIEHVIARLNTCTKDACEVTWHPHKQN